MLQLRVTQQDGRPPALPAGNIKITTTFFTDKPLQGPLPNGSVSLMNFDVVSPFILGDTIMKDTQTYPLVENGTVQFDIKIPDNTATFSIKVT